MPIPPGPPSEAISPDLSDDRLRAVARIIVKARKDKLALRLPADTNWNLSCDCYMWIWHALRHASDGPLGDWLHVPGKHGDLDAVFFIGSVPAVFYRPDVPGQPLRATRARPLGADVPDEPWLSPEMESLYEGDDEASALHVRPRVQFAVNVKEDLSVGAITLQQIDDDGAVTYEWPIAVAEADVLPLGESARPEGVELPPPSVELNEDKAAREEEERKRKEQQQKERQDKDGDTGKSKGA